MAITQIIAPLPAVLNDSETFYEDIAIRNNSLVTVSFPSINTWATQANATQTEINAKAAQVAAQAVNGGYSQDYINDNFFSQNYINDNFVGVNNTQDITEVKTFIASPIVPTPTTNTQAANKQYVDSKTLNINTLPVKTTPVNTDNLALQEVGGDFKKLSFANLKNTLLTYFGVKISSDGFSIKNASDGNIKNQCTAWVNFDGTTTPPTIKDSFNVSDVVRISTGKFRIIIDMDNTNYSVVAGRWYDGTTAEGALAGLYSGEPKTVSSFGIITTNVGPSLSNSSEVSVQIFGGKD